MLLLTIALAAPRHHLMELPREGLEPLRTMVRWEPAASDAPRPVIVWSHGLFGSHEGYEPLIRAWVEAGYVVAQPTHDDSLLGMSRKEIREAMKGPPPLEVWRQRPKDITVVIDALDDLEVKGLPPLDLEHVGMGGHSFGAYTGMLVSGVAAERLHLDDARPDAFLWISPTGVGGKGPGHGKFTVEDFTPVTRPVLFITGSEDQAKVREQDAAWRLTSWEALDAPASLWFVEGAHHNFGGISGRILPNAGGADEALVGWVAGTTTAWWDEQLRGKDPGPWLDPAQVPARTAGRGRLEVKE